MRRNVTGYGKTSRNLEPSNLSTITAVDVKFPFASIVFIVRVIDSLQIVSIHLLCDSPNLSCKMSRDKDKRELSSSKFQKR